jgi:ribosomal protein L20
MLKEAKSHLGEKYNYLLIAMMAIVNSYVGHWVDQKIAKGKFADWMLRIADSKRRSICSQFVARVDNEMVELRDRSVLRLPPYRITPLLLISDPVIYEPGTIELLP